MVDLLIDDIEQTVLDTLALRAKSKGRTLEEEVREILIEAASPFARKRRNKLEEVQKLFEGVRLPDSTQTIREHREDL